MTVFPGGPRLDARDRQCESCGSRFRLPAETLSITCPYCESHLVDATGDEEPVERVVTFEIPRERAARRLSRYLARHWLAPEAIRRAATSSSLRAVLVPFYAFDAESETQFSARIGIHWWRTRTVTKQVDGKLVTETEQVRETDWHELTGTHKAQWFDHLVSASRGLSASETRRLAPYDLGRSRPWAPALVTGTEAERPVVDHATAEASARAEVVARAEEAVAERHLPGDVASGLWCRTAVEMGDVRLALLPVWIAAVPSSRGELRLLVNGQTGEPLGRVPVSYAKVAMLIVLAALVGLILFVTGGPS